MSLCGRHRSATKQRLIQKISEVRRLQDEVHRMVDSRANHVISTAQNLLQVSDRKEFQSAYRSVDAALEYCLVKLLRMRTSLEAEEEFVESSEDEEEKEDLISLNNLEDTSIRSSVSATMSRKETASVNGDGQAHRLSENAMPFVPRYKNWLTHCNPTRATPTTTVDDLLLDCDDNADETLVPTKWSSGFSEEFMPLSARDFSCDQASKCADEMTPMHTKTVAPENVDSATTTEQTFNSCASNTPTRSEVSEVTSQKDASEQRLPPLRHFDAATSSVNKRESVPVTNVPKTATTILPSTSEDDSDDCGICRIFVEQGSRVIGQVTYLESPSSFYIHLCNGESFDLLTDRLNDYYNKNQAAMFTSVPPPGTPCCAMEADKNVWSRAIVTKDIQSSQEETTFEYATVFYVDYGHSERLPLMKLRKLVPEFTSLCRQAVSCRLYGIKPPNEQKSWRETEILFFRDLVAGNNVKVTVISTGDVLMVDLTLMANLLEKEERNVSGMLLEAKMATHDVQHLVDYNIVNGSTSSSHHSALLHQDAKGTVGATLNGCKTNPQLVSISETRVIGREPVCDQNTCVVKCEDVSAMAARSKIDFAIPELHRKLPKSAMQSGRTSSASSVTVDKEEDVERVMRQMRRSHLVPPLPSVQNPANVDLDKSSASLSDAEEITRREAQTVTKLGKYDVPQMELNVKRCGYFQGFLGAVNGPSSFYVHPIAKDTALIDDLGNDLMESYADAKAPLLILHAEQIGIGSYWCACFPDDGKWYRCMVLEVRTEEWPELPDKQTKSKSDVQQQMLSRRRAEITVHVLYIDFGDSAWIPADSLRTLYDKYCTLPALAVECRLADIAPLSEDHSWPPETRELLWKWANGRLLKLQVMDDVDRVVPGKALSVYLWRDDQGNDDQEKESILFNEIIVQKGLADSSIFKADSEFEQEDGLHEDDQKLVLMETHDSQSDQNAAATRRSSENLNEAELLDSLNELHGWNPMEDDYRSLRNSYEVDVDDPGVALTGYKAMDEQNICMFYLRNQPCLRREACPYKHIKPREDGVTTDTMTIPYSFEMVDLPRLDSYVGVRVTAVEHPGKFYVNFPLDPTKSLDELYTKSEHGSEWITPEENLFELLKDMQKWYKAELDRHGNFLLPALGEIVAAKYSQDNCWYRARVLDYVPDSREVRVFFVDYGNVATVSEVHVRNIDPRFLHLPFQAVECALCNIRPFPVGDQWSDRAKELFRAFTEGKNLVVHVVDLVDRKMFVNLYDTVASDIWINDALVNADVAMIEDTDAEAKGSHSWSELGKFVPASRNGFSN